MSEYEYFVFSEEINIFCIFMKPKGVIATEFFLKNFTLSQSGIPLLYTVKSK